MVPPQKTGSSHLNVMISILGHPGAVSRVGKKGGTETKVVRYGGKSPWVPTLTELFPKIQADTGSWLGTKNALYFCAQSGNSFFWVLFVSSYTTAIVSPYLPGSFTKLCVHWKLLFYTFLTRNKGTTDELKKCLGYYQHCPENIPCFWRITIKMRRRWESQISNSLTRQNNNFARASRFFVHFFAVNCTTTRENA